MTCHDAREQLSALLDDVLSVPERQALDAHLVTCADCRRELDQLRKTVALLGRVPPVHAPAGFVDRVMAEAYRPAWPRRLLDALFRPLRVKLPLEAAAVLLIGISALYVYQRAPEVQRFARQETREAPPPLAEAPSTPAAPPAAGAASGQSRRRDEAAEKKRAPVGLEAAREESRQAPPAGPLAPAPAPAPPTPPAPTVRGNDVREAPAVTSEAVPATRPAAPLKSKVEPKLEKETTGEARPDAGGAGTLSATGKVAPSGEPSASRDAAGPRAAPAPSPAETAAPSATAPAPGLEARGGASGIASAPPAAPAPGGGPGDVSSSAKPPAAARPMRAVDASGRLAVTAGEPAEVALDALLGRLGGTRVARRVEGPRNMILIDVVVPGARYGELLEGLKKIGRWVIEYEAKSVPADVRVEIALTVEP